MRARVQGARLSGARGIVRDISSLRGIVTRPSASNAVLGSGWLCQWLTLVTGLGLLFAGLSVVGSGSGISQATPGFDFLPLLIGQVTPDLTATWQSRKGRNPN